MPSLIELLELLEKAKEPKEKGKLGEKVMSAHDQWVQASDLKYKALTETKRLQNMTEYFNELRPDGNAITSGYRDPGDFSMGLSPYPHTLAGDDALMQNRRTVGENPLTMKSGPSGTTIHEYGIMGSMADPYDAVAAERLRRAEAMRDAILGSK